MRIRCGQSAGAVRSALAGWHQTHLLWHRIVGWFWAFFFFFFFSLHTHLGTPRAVNIATAASAGDAVAHGTPLARRLPNIDASGIRCCVSVGATQHDALLRAHVNMVRHRGEHAAHRTGLPCVLRASRDR